MWYIYYSKLAFILTQKTRNVIARQFSKRASELWCFLIPHHGLHCLAIGLSCFEFCRPGQFCRPGLHFWPVHITFFLTLQFLLPPLSDTLKYLWNFINIGIMQLAGNDPIHSQRKITVTVNGYSPTLHDQPFLSLK